MKNKRILVISSLCLAIIVAYSFFSKSKQESANINVAASQGIGVGALGRIEPTSKVLSLYDDSGPDGARVEILHVKEGDDVKAGDIVVTFSSKDRKQAALDLAKIKVEDLKEKVRLQQIAYEISAREYNRYSELLKTKAVSVDAKDKAYAALNQATTDLSSLKSEVASAEVEVTIAENDLKRTYIIAPIDGTVLKIHSHAGEKVSPDGIMEIANLKHFDVVAEIYERDIPRVKIGQKAEILVDGIEKKLQGVVREIGFQVYKNDVNKTDPLSSRDNRIVETRVMVVENDDIELLKHMIYRQVQVRILE